MGGDKFGECGVLVGVGECGIGKGGKDSGGLLVLI